MDALDLILKPDETEPGTAEVYVDGTVDGRPYRFLLDTGAARSSIVADDYTLTFPSIEKHDSSGVFAASSADVITVPGLAVGPIARREFTLVRAPVDSPGTNTLIGMDLLKDFRCRFLFDENRVLLENSAAPAAHPALQALFLDAKAHPYVDVQFGAATAHAVWDTGASLTVVDLAFIRRHPEAFQESGTSTGTDATGTSVETPMFDMAATVIGGATFPPVRVAGVELSPVNATIQTPMDLILGYNILSRAHWLFDFPRRQWAITKPPGE